jgi:MFS family permease
MEANSNDAIIIPAGQKMESPARKVFSNRNFRLLWIGQGMSLIGDQFYMIALPWLVLIMTGDPVALGLVLALTGIPRAVFMLVGGALTDRFSQRSIMLASDMLRLVLTTLLALVVLSGSIQVWMLYVFALAFGTVSGFFLPASNSMVPRIVNKEELMVGNSIIQGTSQLSVFIGPLLAGALLAIFSSGSAPVSGAATPIMTGIGLAFAFDALTFLVSVVTLWMMKVSKPQTGATGAGNILSSIKDGIVFVAKTPNILIMFSIVAILNFLFSGPVLVGLPVIANSRLAEGAAAFGILMAAHAMGNLVGILGSSAIKIKPKNLGILFVGIITAFGFGMASIGFIYSVWIGASILFLLGILNGYIGITLITLLQKRTPPDMMGRLMSLVMFAGVGLVPISQALSGALLKISIEGVFIGGGILIIVMAVMAALSKEVRNIGIEAAL